MSGKVSLLVSGYTFFFCLLIAFPFCVTSKSIATSLLVSGPIDLCLTVIPLIPDWTRRLSWWFTGFRRLTSQLWVVPVLCFLCKQFWKLGAVSRAPCANHLELTRLTFVSGFELAG